MLLPSMWHLQHTHVLIKKFLHVMTLFIVTCMCLLLQMNKYPDTISISHQKRLKPDGHLKTPFICCWDCCRYRKNIPFTIEYINSSKMGDAVIGKGNIVTSMQDSTSWKKNYHPVKSNHILNLINYWTISYFLALIC